MKQWGSYGGFDNMSCWALGNNSVEAIHWISGVVDSSTAAIGLGQGVLKIDWMSSIPNRAKVRTHLASNNVTVSGFMLIFIVAGEGVLHVIRKAVLWMRIVVFRLKGEQGNKHCENVISM